MTNDGGDDPKNKGERMSSDRIAPEDKIWVCVACGKTAVDRYGIEGPRSSGWDESCMLNAVLCERGDIVPGSCMDAIYRLVGFDRETERLAVKYDIPARYILLAKKIAGIDEQQIVGDWPLSPEQVRHIAEVIGKSLNPDAYDFLLEPYAPTSLRDDASV